MNLALAEACDALREMSRLDAQGKFDSPEADAIRDRMADVWGRLSGAERAEIQRRAIHASRDDAGEVLP